MGHNCLRDFNYFSFNSIKGERSPARTSSACGPNNECWSTGNSRLWPPVAISNPLCRNIRVFGCCFAKPKKCCAQQTNIFGRPSTEFRTTPKLSLLLPLLCPTPATSNFLSAGCKWNCQNDERHHAGKRGRTRANAWRGIQNSFLTCT